MWEELSRFHGRNVIGWAHPPGYPMEGCLQRLSLIHRYAVPLGGGHPERDYSMKIHVDVGTHWKVDDWALLLIHDGSFASLLSTIFLV